LPGVDYAQDGQRADTFAKRTPRHAQRLGEFPLDGQPLAGAELARKDHMLDTVDHVVSAGHTGQYRSRARRSAKNI
jgi:hypothetical protein